MGLLMVSQGSYTNSGALFHAIHYITRTRKNETRRNDLICYGILGATQVPEMAIEQFKKVQRAFIPEGSVGKQIFHETYQLKDDEAALLKYDPSHLFSYAYECAGYYYQSGFQVAFAVHWDGEKKYHIHFVGNAVSYADGKKWADNYDKEKIRAQYFSQILLKYCQKLISSNVSGQIICPIMLCQPESNCSNRSRNKNKKNYYAVARGRICGIFDDWYDCQSQIEYYKKPVWKGCVTLESAVIFLEQNMEYRKGYLLALRGQRIWLNDYVSFLDYVDNISVMN